jgi:hypothetical protein
MSAILDLPHENGVSSSAGNWILRYLRGELSPSYKQARNLAQSLWAEIQSLCRLTYWDQLSTFCDSYLSSSLSMIYGPASMGWRDLDGFLE